MLGRIKEKLRIHAINNEWRKHNIHNTTLLGRECNINNVLVGNYTYGAINALTFNENNNLFIGHFCSIAPSVTFLVSSEHCVNSISTFPYKVKVLGIDHEGGSKGDIVVNDDVWIGFGATILSGVEIGQGAIIAAGAVVTHDIPPYSIVGGAPAKIIRYRFSPPAIDFLLTLDYSSLSAEMIRVHIGDLYTSINDMSLEELKELFKWFPKKQILSK